MKKQLLKLIKILHDSYGAGTRNCILRELIAQLEAPSPPVTKWAVHCNTYTHIGDKFLLQSIHDTEELAEIYCKLNMIHNPLIVPVEDYTL